MSLEIDAEGSTGRVVWNGTPGRWCHLMAGMEAGTDFKQYRMKVGVILTSNPLPKKYPG